MNVNNFKLEVVGELSEQDKFRKEAIEKLLVELNGTCDVAVDYNWIVTIEKKVFV